MKFRVCMIGVAGVLLAASASAQSVFTAKLVGFQEAPAVVSTGSGHVEITISPDEKSIDYELTYSGLQGNKVANGKVLFAHIHVGQRNVAGGVAVFFCGGGKSAATQAPAQTQARSREPGLLPT